VRWAPSTGLLLLAATALAVAVTTSPLGPGFAAWWRTPLGLGLGSRWFTLAVVDWVNDGLLTVFFLVVGLEVKRELTVGRLASWRAASLPIAASLGGMAVPALVYLLVIPPGPLMAGWGTTISTDTAFAVALVVLLGDRVPVDLRVFLTAAVIVDDLVAIAVIAIFYSGAIDVGWLVAAALATAALVALARAGIYRALPYALLGVALWVFLHEAGLHPTLAGVILAVTTPTRPPANLRALMAQARTVIEAETRGADDTVLRHGPSEPALHALDVIHARIESPASKLLRSIEPWSSYVVLPIFALANAGVPISLEGIGDALSSQVGLGVALGLVIGAPLGGFLFAWAVLRVGAGRMPEGLDMSAIATITPLKGIGFTIAIFISVLAFDERALQDEVKLAILMGSATAALIGLVGMYARDRALRNRHRA
jgi:Na+:H+ antiporter, NhaA family